MVSDRLVPIAGRLEATVYDFDGDEQWSLALPAGIAANGSTRVLSTPASWVLAGSDPQRAVLVARFLIEDEIAAEDLLFFVRPKELDLIKPDITVDVSGSGRAYTIALESDVLAKNVYLQLDEGTGHFSDNFFDLLPGRERTVDLIVTDRHLDVPSFLRVTTLFDTYVQ